MKRQKWISLRKTRKSGSWFPSFSFPRTVKNVIVGTICYKKSKISSRTNQDANIPIRTINDHSETNVNDNHNQSVFYKIYLKYLSVVSFGELAASLIHLFQNTSQLLEIITAHDIISLQCSENRIQLEIKLKSLILLQQIFRRHLLSPI